MRLLIGVVCLAELLNPLTRVAELLENLSRKIEQEGKAEEKLYNKFSCWCKKTESEKTEAIEAANLRITNLQAYVDDIENGRIEFTTQREDLEREIASLTSRLEKESAMRAESQKTFEAAEKEMQDAVTALTSALGTLAKGTSGDFMSVNFDLSRLLMNEAVRNNPQASLISKMLQPGNKDWEKLNAVPEKEYAARSTKIQQILRDMKGTFADNLLQSQKQNEKEIEDYGTLKKQKKSTLTQLKSELNELKEEHGARGTALEESKTEIEELQTENSTNQQLLDDAGKQCDEKKAEWAERQKVRADEAAAISEAMGVLRSDDARDTFKSSFDSQTPGFLQTTNCQKKRRQLAVSALVGTSAKVQKVRSSLKNEAFGKVIAAIEKVVTELDADDVDDEKKKNKCETQRAEKTLKAKESSNVIDDHSDEIERQNKQKADLQEDVKGAEREIKLAEDEEKELEEQRSEQHNAFVASDRDDAEAVALIEKAVVTLKKFYAKSFAQKQVHAHSRKQPGPATWDQAEYGGKQEAGKSVVAILELIKSDVEKDKTTAEKSESDLLAAFEEFQKINGEKITGLNSQIDTAKESIGHAVDTITDAESNQESKKKLLDSYIKEIHDIAPNCDFITVHFETRKGNRQLERDGLNKAKAALQGAEFGLLQC
eukprot:GEMP01010792.1.p1 GENE.GEMP01010792.1~~GEMP01010792.1.p1  ORF type:complete len:658 (+),score=219.85 GEMP01010792.1:245-2218(+)